MGTVTPLRPTTPPADLLAAIDAQIDRSLDALRESTVLRRTVTRPATTTDHVIIDLEARCTLPDGATRRLFAVREHPYGEGDRYALFPWSLDGKVTGQSAGDPLTFDPDPTVPPTYPDPDYHGLPARLDGRIVRVEEWSDPLPLSDGLVLLRTGFPSIAAYRAAVRDGLLLQAGFPGVNERGHVLCLQERR